MQSLHETTFASHGRGTVVAFIVLDFKGVLHEVVSLFF